MKIKWHKVTWYSWLLSGVVFLIIVPLLVIYFVGQYHDIELINSQTKSMSIEAPVGEPKSKKAPLVSKNQPTVAPVDSIGTKIAEWASINHTSITINTLEITQLGFNGGGYTPVYWDFKQRPEKVAELRANLTELIQKSSCNVSELENYVGTIVTPDHYATKEQFVKNISCLGKIEFQETSFSSD